MSTMILDCMGFDPDAVFEKLLKVQNTIWVSPPHAELASGILGWPRAFRRIKGGVEVEIDWLEAPFWGGGRTNFAGLAEKGLLDLSIAGWREPGDDFSINRLVAQLKR